MVRAIRERHLRHDGTGARPHGDKCRAESGECAVDAGWVDSREFPEYVHGERRKRSDKPLASVRLGVKQHYSQRFVGGLSVTAAVGKFKDQSGIRLVAPGDVLLSRVSAAMPFNWRVAVFVRRFG
jgi:hypothetical protein